MLLFFSFSAMLSCSLEYNTPPEEIAPVLTFGMG